MNCRTLLKGVGVALAKAAFGLHGWGDEAKGAFAAGRAWDSWSCRTASSWTPTRDALFAKPLGKSDGYLMIVETK